MFTSLGNVIPTDWARRYTFDGNGNSTTGSNNATVTNPVWIKSQRMYQNQCLSWGTTTSCTYASVTYTNSYIWIYASGVWTFTKNSSKVTATALNGVNGERYAGLTFFNRTLTADEEQLLQLEGLKLLGPTSVAKYPKLFEGLVGYFENPTLTTELWNIANGVKATYVGGTNTTDNLGISRAISNPNYTWSSITYTTGYTFENSGSGWQIVISPSGLSATGINRTTTLRNVFLFNRILSSDETAVLQTICNSDYIYPSQSYDLPNLRDGLVLDLNEQGKDLSGNGNDGTLVNSPTVVRQGKAKGLSYNGSNQYIETSSNILPNLVNNCTFRCWVYNNSASAIQSIFSNGNSATGSNLGWYFGIKLDGVNNTYNFTKPGIINENTGITPVTGAWQHLVLTISGYRGRLYINGNLVWTGSNTATIQNNTGTIKVGMQRVNGTTSQFYNGKEVNPRLWNRILSDREIQEDYYSQKANFIY